MEESTSNQTALVTRLVIEFAEIDFSMQLHKTAIKYVLSSLGYELRRTNNRRRDPFEDMGRFVTLPNPILFDVGANLGQTIDNFRRHFKRSTIHSFEPSPSTFHFEQTVRVSGRNPRNERWLRRSS
jgi:hypothetical protein